jgi:hypothetical protein
VLKVNGLLGLSGQRVGWIEDRRVSTGLEFFKIFETLVNKVMDVHISVKYHVTVGQSNRLFIVFHEFTISDVQQLQGLTKGLTLLLKQ